MTDGDREFGKVEARLDALVESFVDFRTEMRSTLLGLRADVTGRLNDHARRLGRLERWRAFIAGGLFLLALVLTFGKWLVSFFFWPGRG